MSEAMTAQFSAPAPWPAKRAFYAEAPFDGRGRFLPLGRAFQIARSYHLPRREAAKTARRSAFTSARYRSERAATMPVAVDHVALVVADELARLGSLARDLDGQDDAARLGAAASAIEAMAARGRARLAARADKIEEARHV